MKKYKTITFSLTVSLILVHIITAVAFCQDCNFYKAEQAIHAYIDGYLQVPSDMGKIFCADNYLYKQISSKTKQAPKALQDKEFSKAAKELQNDLSIHEKGKNDGTFIFNNPLSVNTRGGDSLYSILYKNMKYKIMEVRDGKEPWADASRKEAFLELTYDSPGRAPTNLGKKKIKKAVVKIIFAEWKSGNKVNYKVTHYEPTEYGLEYFP